MLSASLSTRKSQSVFRIPPCWHSRIANGPSGNEPGPVELALYSVWFPFFDGSKHFDFQLEANLPKEYVTITNSQRKTQREHEDRSVTVWTTYQPTFDMALLTSPKLRPPKREIDGAV